MENRQFAKRRNKLGSVKSYLVMVTVVADYQCRFLIHCEDYVAASTILGHTHAHLKNHTCLSKPSSPSQQHAQRKRKERKGERKLGYAAQGGRWGSLHQPGFSSVSLT